MDMDLLTNIFYAMIRTGTPLLLVALGELGAVVLAAWNDVQIELDRHTAPGQVEANQQVGDALVIRQFEGFTIQLDTHDDSVTTRKRAGILAR